MARWCPKRLTAFWEQAEHRLDPSSHTFLREIPQCWFTGQAAGVAAALAAASGTPPRHVAVRAIQHELLRQGAYLSPAVATALAQVSSAAE
jgi:FAD dependent oxidoreductase